MDKKSDTNHQHIGCTVETCKYNECENECCTLSSIKVAPVEGKETTLPDDSMCASYECNCNEHNKKTDNFFG